MKNIKKLLTRNIMHVSSTYITRPIRKKYTQHRRATSKLFRIKNREIYESKEPGYGTTLGKLKHYYKSNSSLSKSQDGRKVSDSTEGKQRWKS